MRALLCGLASLALSIGPGVPAIAQSTGATPRLDDLVGQLGALQVRGIDSDIAFPATSAEYEAMGKNAVLMLSARSALDSELPLRSVYVMANGVRVPLQRIVLLGKARIATAAGGGSEEYIGQVSFYLLPIYLLKTDSQLKVDFAGQRTNFGVSTFRPDTLQDAPTFVRADEFRDSSEPDMEAVRAMVIREFPSVLGAGLR